MLERTKEKPYDTTLRVQYPALNRTLRGGRVRAPACVPLACSSQYVWYLQEAIDTTRAAGELTFHTFAALAEFERDLVRERTNAGLAAARRRGTQLGRPRALTAEVQMAEAMMADPNLSARRAAEQLGVHRSTLYRYLKLHQGSALSDGGSER